MGKRAIRKTLCIPVFFCLSDIGIWLSIIVTWLSIIVTTLIIFFVSQVSDVHVCEATLLKRLIEFENTDSGSLTVCFFLRWNFQI